MTAEFFRDEGDVALDFYPFDSQLAAATSAIPLLREQSNVELLPLGHIVAIPSYCNWDSPMFRVVHCRNRLKLLAGSTYTCFPGTNTIMHLERAVVSKERLRGAQLFKFAGNPISFYCTDSFRSAVEESCLKGLHFEQTDFEIVLT